MYVNTPCYTLMTNTSLQITNHFQNTKLFIYYTYIKHVDEIFFFYSVMYSP